MSSKQMKILMENWRMMGPRYSFERLCENLDKGLISEQQAALLWERKINEEHDFLLEEGLFDIIKQGYEGAKGLAGAAKAKYDSAVQKLVGFFYKMMEQAYLLALKAQKMAGKIISVLKGIYDKANKWCSAHPVLCRVIKVLLSMIAVMSVVAFYSASAQAQIATPEGAVFNDTYLTAMKGFLAYAAETKDPESQQAFGEAVDWINRAMVSPTTEVMSEAPELVQKADATIQKLTANEKWAGINKVLELGEQVKVTVTREVVRYNGVLVKDETIITGLSVSR